MSIFYAVIFWWTMIQWVVQSPKSPMTLKHAQSVHELLISMKCLKTADQKGLKRKNKCEREIELGGGSV